MLKIHAADDGRLWSFCLPGIERSIHLESPNYESRFIAEHWDMKALTEAMEGWSIDEAFSVVAAYLRSLA
jgi:hypothetical protein